MISFPPINFRKILHSLATVINCKKKQTPKAQSAQSCSLLLSFLFFFLPAQSLYKYCQVHFPLPDWESLCPHIGNWAWFFSPIGTNQLSPQPTYICWDFLLCKAFNEMDLKSNAEASSGITFSSSPPPPKWSLKPSKALLFHILLFFHPLKNSIRNHQIGDTDLIPPKVQRSLTRSKLSLPDSCYIDYGDLVLNDKIHDGNVSVIYEGEYQGQEAAIKIYNPALVDVEEFKAEFKRLRWAIPSSSIIRFFTLCIIDLLSLFSSSALALFVLHTWYTFMASVWNPKSAS